MIPRNPHPAPKAWAKSGLKQPRGHVGCILLCVFVAVGIVFLLSVAWLWHSSGVPAS